MTYASWWQCPVCGKAESFGGEKEGHPPAEVDGEKEGHPPAEVDGEKEGRPPAEVDQERRAKLPCRAKYGPCMCDKCLS